MKIAIVRNRNNDGVFSNIGQPCPERYGRRSVQLVMNALRTAGHTVKIFEGDINLFANLKDFIPPDPATGLPSGMVFNMSYGIQGDSRYTHVPAMLEMAGIPYTGPGPYAHVVSLDKVLTKLIMERHHIPTPKFCVLGSPEQQAGGLRYPLIVKPRHESTSLGIQVVSNKDELRQAVEAVLTEYQQDALVEEYIDGREFAIGLLDVNPIELLPIVELEYRDKNIKILTKPDKFHKSTEEPKKICPAPIDDKIANNLKKLAVSLYRLCQCRDYARVDVRLDRDGNPFVLEINSMTTLGTKGGFVLAARKAGYTFKRLVWRILDIAHERYFNCPAPRGVDTLPIRNSNQQIKQTSIQIQSISDRENGD